MIWCLCVSDLIEWRHQIRGRLFAGGKGRVRHQSKKKVVRFTARTAVTTNRLRHSYGVTSG